MLTDNIQNGIAMKLLTWSIQYHHNPSFYSAWSGLNRDEKSSGQKYLSTLILYSSHHIIPLRLNSIIQPVKHLLPECCVEWHQPHDILNPCSHNAHGTPYSTMTIIFRARQTATKNDHLKNTCKCVIDTVGFSKLRDTFFLCTKQGVQLVISLGQFPGQFALKNLQ